jgi:hypothetical protein
MELLVVLRLDRRTHSSDKRRLEVWIPRFRAG